MKSIVCIAALGLCVVSACAGTPVSHYHMVIDPKLPNRYATAAYAAADDWMAILDGKLVIDYDWNRSPCRFEDFEICVVASSHAAILAMGGSDGNIGFTEWYPYSQNAIVYIPVVEDQNETAEQRLKVALHEAGHAMQLYHLEVGVMNAEIGSASSSVSCHDAAYWTYLRTNYQWSTWPGNKSCPPSSFVLSGS